MISKEELSESSLRALAKDRFYMQHLTCAVVPAWTVVMATIMCMTRDRPCPKLMEEDLNSGMEVIMAEAVSILIVKIVLLREGGGRVGLLAKYLEKLLALQLVSQVLGLMASGAKGDPEEMMHPSQVKQSSEQAAVHNVPCVVADIIALSLGIWIARHYFGWSNPMSAIVAHWDVLAITGAMHVFSFIHYKRSNVPPAEAFFYVVENAEDWMEVWFFFGGVWEVIKPRLLQECKIANLGDDTYRKQAVVCWSWFLAYFALDDCVRPYWEGQFVFCNARVLMAAHELHLLLCCDFAAFYLYQVFMPNNYYDQDDIDHEL
eukprot:gnl/MRDRNA2_/MRDRNA2_145298_c0_seq1.p1 gnl/MRDRNA2_/MRDRNA2_145298_c0~~gnl/MRDRNA2_/MRDRNA2_145298_c0_seq1.p1  ORF type:complete len:318 (-),score=45.74 gnl/MRDRNA2_/MRDRNA2_145298_c0_seq1:16-969(-)